MKPHFACILPVVLLLIAGTLSCTPPEPAQKPQATDEGTVASPAPPPPSPEEEAEHEKAAAKIKKCGGRIRVDENGFVAVFFTGSDTVDDDLVHLNGLTKVDVLGLESTKITDAGLEHLEGLTELKMLLLTDTAVTDASLDRLGKMSQLKQLELSATEITEEAVEKLKELLPKCEIIHQNYK